MCLCIRAYKCIWCQFLMIGNVDCICVYNCICTCICICICICICTCNRLLLLSSSRSTTAAISTTTPVTIFLDHQRHRKSQQSPLPRGCEVPPRKSCPTLNRSGRSPTRVRRGWVLPHSIASVQGPQAEEHRGVSAASLRGQRCWINQHA